MMKRYLIMLSILCVFITALAIPANAQKTPVKLKYGKYWCTASKYRNGSYEYIPRGSFQIKKDGSYTYLGLKKPSLGRFQVDKKGNLSFKGGYFDKGKAEKFEGEDRFFVVFPTNPDNRWTCSCKD